MCKGVFTVLGILLCLVPVIALAEPLTLLDGLKTATEENRLIKIREEEERMARADTVVARSKLLPRASTSYAQTFLENQPGVHFGPLSPPTSERSYYTYSIVVRQLLYDFGGAISLYRGAKLEEETKRLETRRTRNGVALSFSVLYFDTLESEKLITVAEREIEALESQVQVAKDLFRGGVITKNDLLQAEVRLANARQKLLAARNMRRINGARINSMLTRPLATPVGVVEVTRQQAEALPEETQGDIAEKERPEMQIVESTLKALSFEETAVRSEYFPHFFAQSEYDYVKNKYVTHEQNLGIVFSMSLNLFAGGSTKARIEKVRFAQSRLRIERKKLADEIRLELEKYCLDMANAKERLKVARGAISQAEENLRITRLKYAEGVGIATDVTDAIALRALSETNYYRALYDYYRSEAGYLYAMGRDLEEEYRE